MQAAPEEKPKVAEPEREQEPERTPEEKPPAEEAAEEQAEEAEEPPPRPGVVFDGRMSGEPRDIVALAAVFGLAMSEAPEAETAAFSLTHSPLAGAAFVDAVARFYNRVHLREYPERFQRYRGLPVGLGDSPALEDSAPSLQTTLARNDDDGEPRFPHEVRKLTDTADPAALIRNALTSREDDSAVIILTGAATNLASVLGLNRGREVIKSKVKRLVVAADLRRLRADIDAARTLFEDWPTPVFVIDQPSGEALSVSTEALDRCIWTEVHPVVEALRAAGSPAAVDLRLAAAVVLAVRPDADLFEVSEPGVAGIESNGSFVFESRPDGLARTVSVATPQALRSELAALITAKPAARELPEFLKRFIEKEKQEERERQEQEGEEQARQGGL